MRDPVDAIITWVDGNDEAHEKKLKQYLASQGIERPESAAPTRYNQLGEINYCLRSLFRFAAWIRTIYIVTDAQTPDIINLLAGTPEAEKIRLIDHKDIFSGFEQYLPTFNSLSIESVLWRIPGLANKFIYLNDDCVLLRPVEYEDFFKDNKPVIRGDWKLQSHKKWLYRLKNYFASAQPLDNPHRLLQENTARLAGFSKYFFHLPHIPFAMKKETLKNFFHQHPQYLEKNISYPLRDPQQFWTISLAQHLDIKANNACFNKSLEAITINGAGHSQKKIQQRLAQADKKNNIAFLCIQSLDITAQPIQALILNWLDKRQGKL